MTRKEEIENAIYLVGWLDVDKRIKTPEDRTLFKQLEHEFAVQHKADQDNKLQKAGISF